MDLKKLLLGCGIAMISMVCLPAFGQCNNKIELVKVTPDTNGLNSGKIEFKVQSSTSYTIKLTTVEGIQVKELKSQSGSGGGSYTFSNLDGKRIYDVTVDFRDETSFLCKSKSIVGIFLTDKP
jgi:hypothetical protein